MFFLSLRLLFWQLWQSNFDFRKTGKRRRKMPAVLRHVNGDLEEFRNELYKEVGDNTLVDAYLASLMEKCEGDLQVAMQLHMDFAEKYWGPVFHAFIRWVLATTGDAPIVLLLRDIWGVGKLVERGLVAEAATRKITPLYVSRAILGIEDEAHEPTKAAQAELLRIYLQPLFQPGVVVVDTGCWGTILVKLNELYGLKVPARYLFSHNPYVPGFLNWIGVPDPLAEVFNDSIEVLLCKGQDRVTELRRSPDPLNRDQLMRVNGHDVEPIRRQVSPMSYYLHEAAKMGITLSKNPTRSQLLYTIRRMAELHVETRETGVWTGILGRNTPTWGKGAAFVAAYPEALRSLNPPELLPGGYAPDRPQVNLGGLSL